MNGTPNKGMGYLVWVFGVLGAHRVLTLGLLGIGWLIDLFLIPSMDRQAEDRFQAGPVSYNISWVLLTFLGIFGLHRFYMGKLITGLIYLLTGGLFLIGVLYDFWTLNDQVAEKNSGWV